VSSRSTPERRPLRDPRLPVGEMFDPVIAKELWDGLSAECRRDHFDKSNLPARYRSVVQAASAGGPWTTVALNMRGLPEPMTWELAWLVHREAELGRRLYPSSFNGATFGLRMATSHGGAAGRAAVSLMQLTPQEWVHQVQAARLRGHDVGLGVDARLAEQVSRWQDVLVYPYHRGEWWRLDVWNPLLDRRVPQRDHEPQGRAVANFSHLTTDWLRTAAKWWLSDCLESGRYSWSSLKTRLNGLKWLQRYLTVVGDAGPALVADPDELRPFVRGFLAHVRAHEVTSGPEQGTGKRLAGNPLRQLLTTTEQFYAYMFDNRVEAARVLAEPRWLTLTSAHSVLFRAGDKPRLTNRKSPDMVLEDEVVSQIATGAELLALPKDQGGLEDLSAFHALMLLIRLGRRVNEVLLMDFDPLLPLVGAPSGADSASGAMVTRLQYRQIKVQSLQPATIPVDAEIVAIITAQQEVSRRFAASMGYTGAQPRYLFLRQRVNRNCEHPYAAASLHCRLAQLSDRLGLTDSQGRPVRISRTHRFRHTAATNLLNAGVPLHVVMRYFGHQSPDMTLHYAVTLSQTAEKEFLRFKKVTADGRAVTTDPSDLYDLLQLDQRADRILPNGWCMLPPKQSCSRGNACLTCDKFATDASHTSELTEQLTATRRLVERRRAAFLTRFGTPMSEDNVWLQGRHQEITSLQGILLAVEATPGQAVRGAGTRDSPTMKEAAGE